MGLDWGDIGQGILDVGTVGLDRVAGKVLDSTQNHYNQTAPGGTAYRDATSSAAGQMATGYGQQQDYIHSLQNQAAGNGPSVAQQMLQRATQQNMQNNASAIASQRGMNPALASKLLLDQNAATQQNAAGQGAQMRAGEMLNANSLLGQAIGQSRGQSIGAFGQAGGLENQAQLGAGQINSGVAAGNAATNKALVGGALNAAGAAMGMPGVGSAVTGGGGSGTMGSNGLIQPQFAQGGPVASQMLQGGKVPGKAQTPGDSPHNDTVSAKLSPGEIVLPRSVTQGDDAPEAAAAFVRAILRRKNKTKTKTEGTLHHVRKARAALDALASHMGDGE